MRMMSTFFAALSFVLGFVCTALVDHGMVGPPLALSWGGSLALVLAYGYVARRQGKDLIFA